MLFSYRHELVLGAGSLVIAGIIEHFTHQFAGVPRTAVIRYMASQIAQLLLTFVQGSYMSMGQEGRLSS